MKVCIIKVFAFIFSIVPAVIASDTDSISSSSTSISDEVSLKDRAAKARSENDKEALFKLEEDVMKRSPTEEEILDIFFPKNEIEEAFYSVYPATVFKSPIIAYSMILCAKHTRHPIVFDYLARIYGEFADHTRDSYYRVLGELEEMAHDWDAIESTYVVSFPNVLKRFGWSKDSKGSAYDCFTEGLRLESDEGYEEAREMYQQAADQGCIDAFSKIAVLIATGKVSGDEAELASVLEKGDRPYIAYASTEVAQEMKAEAPTFCEYLWKRALKLRSRQAILYVIKNVETQPLIEEVEEVSAHIVSEIEKLVS